MSDLTDELWNKGFTPVNSERWCNRDRERVRLMHDEIERLTAEAQACRAWAEDERRKVGEWMTEAMLQDKRIAELEAENTEYLRNGGAMLDRISKLEAAICKALPVAAELDCMLASGAKSKRAYDKMQDKAEYIREALAKLQEKGDE